MLSKIWIFAIFSPNVSNLGKPLGPLPMYPVAEDNYGYYACAVLCLPCVPNILVIATETGTLYHCVVLEAGDEEDGGVRMNSALFCLNCAVRETDNALVFCMCRL